MQTRERTVLASSAVQACSTNSQAHTHTHKIPTAITTAGGWEFWILA